MGHYQNQIYINGVTVATQKVLSHFHRKDYIYTIHLSLETSITKTFNPIISEVAEGPTPSGPDSAEQKPLLGCQALAMDFVLLQLFMIWMPEFHNDPFNVESIYGMGRNDFPVYLQSFKKVVHVHWRQRCGQCVPRARQQECSLLLSIVGGRVGRWVLTSTRSGEGWRAFY